tara:strand:+ start:3402 stop:4679 length:1278 start_codon:yes stop_codon:yes gene_type:complete
MKRFIKIFIITAVVLIAVIYFKLISDNGSYETCNIHNIDDIHNIDYNKHDRLTTSAGTLYEGDVLKNILQGKNYRDAWTAKIDVPILFLDTLHGGVNIVKEGGGKQTQSLRLKSSDDLYLTLRSVNKNPDELIPEYAKTLGLETVVIDGISAQHPYASVVVAKLSDVINLLHTHPKLVFLPKQAALKSYNSEYGNRLYHLEFENKGTYNWTTLESVIEIIDTEDLQKLKITHRSKLEIDKKMLIRARLFDLIIGDWDRHAKQWGWIVTEKDSTFLAHPLPMDRDNAFFKVEGIIPSLISDESITPKLQSFDERIDYLEGLVYDFDLYFLQNVSQADFTSEAKFIQEQLTDQNIEQALRLWNTELYNLYADEIKTKLKARRDNLIPIAAKFHSIIKAKPLLNKTLKGSEPNIVNRQLLKCFDCIEK